MVYKKPKKLSAPSLKKFIRELKTPEGFSRSDTDVKGDQWTQPHTSVVFTKKDGTDFVEFKMNFYNDTYNIACGHTSFSTSKGVRCFDRLGVEDSFYFYAGETLEKANAKILEQIEKIKVSRARIDLSENVPGLPFLCTPELKASITAKLKAGQTHSFMPSGFGTGYRLYVPGRGRKASRYDSRCKPETEAFFGVSPIFYSKLDCD